MKEIASISLTAKSSIPILSCSRITDLNMAFTKPDRPRVNFFANLTDSLTVCTFRYLIHIDNLIYT